MAASTSFLTVTVLLIALIVCGEIHAAAGGTVQPHEPRTAGELMAPRTFGRIRMMKNFMLPMMFMLGVIKMLLMFLVGITLKTLLIAKSILVVNLSIGLAKVINFFKHNKHGDGGGHGHYSPSIGYGGGWSNPEKNINIHIHSDPGHTLSLEGPPAIHSSAFPYTTRSDVLEPVYAPLPTNTYSYGQNPLRTNQPYTSWPSISRS